MIGSNFLSSSSWGSESLLSRDFLPAIDSFVLDIGLEQNCISTGNSKQKWEEQSSSYSGSPVHSTTSEDCDWSAFDVDIDNILPVDSLASQLLEEEENIIDSLDLDDLDWVSLSSTNFHEQGFPVDDANNNVFASIESPSKKHTKSPERIPSSSKSWSKMTTKERLKTAHALSEFISRQMDLRGQIEVIKLIDPTAVLSSDDTEFAINLSYLNDVKLKRICEYLRKHTTGLTDIDSLCKSKPNNTSSCHRAKRKQKKSCNPPNEVKLRQKKVSRQDKKEKRSGLFVREEIVKKTSDPQEEDDFVNILE